MKKLNSKVRTAFAKALVATKSPTARMLLLFSVRAVLASAQVLGGGGGSATNPWAGIISLADSYVTLVGAGVGGIALAVLGYEHMWGHNHDTTAKATKWAVGGGLVAFHHPIAAAMGLS